jgi:murein DD-endopeptidase MepM/ murein hydrolase activator NlpD
MKMFRLFFILVAIGVVAVVGYFLAQQLFRPVRVVRVVEWIRNPEAHPDWAVAEKARCGEAPFIQPTSGYIGFLWGDSFRPGHHHQGIDTFGGEPAGMTPVVAAYDGYLTRQPDWKSSVIIRIPQDPLMPSRQIWTYYTHLADREGKSFISSRFPPGSSEIFVPAGTLLGYQGDYSGNPGNPVGVHLHFSIVRDDGNGHYLNELEKDNTLDPSPYFNINLNAKTRDDSIPLCEAPAAADDL